MPYLTPDDPPVAFVTITLEVPDDPGWLALFFGAITELHEAENFEQFGTLTPDETSQIWQDIIEAIVVT